MTLLLPERESKQVSGGSSVDYPEMFANAQREVEPVPLADYQNLAKSLAEGREYSLKSGFTMQDADSALRETYVYDEPDMRLARFAEAAIDLPRMSAMQAWLDRNPDVPAGPGKDKVIQCVYAITEFDHLLRNMMLEGRESFDRVQLVAMLNEASGSRAKNFVTAEVRGITAEIALHDALKAHPDYDEVEFTSVVDDFRGTDVTGYHRGRNGGRIGFDAKFENKRKQKVSTNVVNGQRIPHVTIAIPDSAIDGLHLSEMGKMDLHRKIDTLVAAGVS